jgi:dGTPase
VVETLENGVGLNLTWEVRDGILNHRTATCPRTLEGAAVRIADKIAYINHDIDDAVRAGLLSEDDLPVESLELFGKGHGVRINAMILDVVGESMGQPFVRMTAKGQSVTGALREYLFRNLYRDPRALEQEKKAESVLKKLFSHYMEHPEALPAEFLAIVERDSLERAVCDYIAGMSDQYAIQKFMALCVPSPTPAAR